MAAYSLPFDARCDLHLSILEAPFRPHRAVQQAVRRELRTASLARYPLTASTEQKGLRAQIAEYLHLQAAWAPDEHILLTNGSDNALKLIAEYVGGEADVLVPWPTYPHMVKFLQDSGALTKLPIKMSSAAPGDNSLALQVAKALGARNHRAVYICSPNLPLGYRVAPDDVRRLASLFPQTIFIVDQAYAEFAAEDDGKAMAKCACDAANGNVVLVRTFSKAFALASLRIGYLVASKDLRTCLSRRWNEKNVTSIAVAAASASLRQLPYYCAQWKEVRRTKSRFGHSIESALTDQHPDSIYGYEYAVGNWVLLSSRDPAALTERFASEFGIEVRNKHDDVPCAVRVAVGTPQQMQRVARAVRMINLHQTMYDGTVVVDLDDTLRAGSRVGGAPLPGAIEFVRRHCERLVVCSNNAAYTPEEIVRDLHAVGFPIELSASHLCTPVSCAAQIARCGRAFVSRPLVVAANIHLVDFILAGSQPAYEPEEYTCAFLLTASTSRLDDRVMLALSFLARARRPIFYSYNEQWIPFANAADASAKPEHFPSDCHSLALPEVGWLVNFLVHHAGGDRRRMIPLGKPSTRMLRAHRKHSINKAPIAAVVGDRVSSDGALARSLRVPFVHVGGDKGTAKRDDFTLRVDSLEELL